MWYFYKAPSQKFNPIKDYIKLISGFDQCKIEDIQQQN